MKNKKVVLINAPHTYMLGGWISLLTYPLSILAPGSYLTAHDVPVELIDVQMDFGIGSTLDAERIIIQRVAQYLHDQADTISWVGISVMSKVNSELGLALAKDIHDVLPDIPIISRSQ